MNSSADNYKDVDDYIARSSADVQDILQQIRATIKKNAPQTIESIAYAMPAYKLNGKPLVYFAAFPKHIGFYATPEGHEAFEEELSKYKRGKGSVQFPLDQPIPYDLIARITAYKVNLLS
jgi:uncharacterized protein YdhG (YjbR/CyaY superfamily)